MRYDLNKHHRRSIRLRGYNYATPRAYFVTVCVYGWRCLFGAVVDGDLVLNDAGRMVRAIWDALPGRFPALAPDSAVIMPNHFHAIVVIAGIALLPERAATAQPTLGVIVGAFKSLTTNAYIRGVQDQNWEPFDQRLWQRNYYEHIVRDDNDLANIHDYIQHNPARWADDQLHPAAAPNRFNQE